MDFFIRFRKVIAWIVIFVFLLGGGYGVVFNMTIGDFSQSAFPVQINRNINQSEEFKVEDYYKVYEEGDNYKIYVKRIYMDILDDYCYLKKYELYDLKGNIAFEGEGALINIRITQHDNNILEINEYFEDTDEGNSLFFNVNTNEISRLWYATVNASGNSLIVDTKEGPAAIVKYDNKAAIVNLYDKDKYFKNIKFEENQFIPHLDSLDYISEDKVEIMYLDADYYSKHSISLPLIDDEIGRRSFDFYEYKLKENAITIDQNLYGSFIENMTYDEICNLTGIEGELVRHIEEGDITVYGYKGESQEIFLGFYQGKLGEKQRYFNVTEN